MENETIQNLFAFGYDAMTLLPHLAKMRAFPGFYRHGLTGKLNVNELGQVERQLAWAQFKKKAIVSREFVY